MVFHRISHGFFVVFLMGPQVGLEPTTLRLTAGSNNYCGILSDFASSCFLVLSHRKPTDLVLVSICRAVL